MFFEELLRTRRTRSLNTSLRMTQTVMKLRFNFMRLIVELIELIRHETVLTCNDIRASHKQNY